MRHCGECGAKLNDIDDDYCDRCFFDLMHPKPQQRRMSRYERMEMLADMGTDTWEEYHDER